MDRDLSSEPSKSRGKRSLRFSESDGEQGPSSAAPARAGHRGSSASFRDGAGSRARSAWIEKLLALMVVAATACTPSAPDPSAPDPTAQPGGKADGLGGSANCHDQQAPDDAASGCSLAGLWVSVPRQTPDQPFLQWKWELDPDGSSMRLFYRYPKDSPTMFHADGTLPLAVLGCEYRTQTGLFEVYDQLTRQVGWQADLPLGRILITTPVDLTVEEGFTGDPIHQTDLSYSLVLYGANPGVMTIAVNFPSTGGTSTAVVGADGQFSLSGTNQYDDTAYGLAGSITDGGELVVSSYSELLSIPSGILAAGPTCTRRG